MKPLFLEIQAFGPYVEKQTVNFQKLAEQGMFLIKGPTGSGKTTIFDAMTFALYGGSSGDDPRNKFGRNDLEEWRCNQADGTVPTVVSFTFLSHGRRYRFTRRLVLRRKNFSAEYAAGELDEDGNLIPFFENPKKDDLTRKAEELVGLTKEQFRQVVLLPQGQFERFLTASSDEKESILEKIFDAEKWDAYAQRFFDAANERKAGLVTEKSMVAASLAEEKLDSIEELSNRIAEIEAEVQMWKAEKAAYNAEEKQKQLNHDRELSARFEPLHSLEREQQALQARAEEMRENRSRYEKAEKAETLREVISAYERAEEDRRKRLDEAARYNAQLPDAQRRFQSAQKEKQDNEAHSPVAGLNGKIGEYEAKQSVYQVLSRRQEAFERENKTLEAQKRTDMRARQELEAATRQAKEAFEAYDSANSQASALRGRYYSGIYGELAAALQENTPCPVCGSIHHPAPARRSSGSVSKEDVEQAEKTAEAKKEHWKQLDEKRSGKEQCAKRESDRLKDAQVAQMQAKTDLENAKANLIDGVPDLDALNKKLGDFRKEIARYTEVTGMLDEAWKNANDALNRLTTKIDGAKKECAAEEERCASARTAMEAALEKAGYPDPQAAKRDMLPGDERAKRYGQIVAWDTAVRKNAAALEEKRRELAGREEPDAAQFEARQKEIQAKSDEFGSKISTLQTTSARLQKKQKDLQAKWEHYRSSIQEAEDDLAFAKKLRGDTGIGLQRYVLAVMFNQVIGEANRMLEKVHGGRYRLYRTEDKGRGNKRGLELKVHDNRSPDAQGRSVAMLSGGEKFLVSLSLSIGLSTVAQKSGVQTEALFIDEGFGTLDDSSIHDAMDILESVRRSSGMIGIISHVQLLESNIPTHLEVIKSSSGSTIESV